MEVSPCNSVVQELFVMYRHQGVQGETAVTRGRHHRSILTHFSLQFQADMRSREHIRQQLCTPLEVTSSGPQR